MSLGKPKNEILGRQDLKEQKKEVGAEQGYTTEQYKTATNGFNTILGDKELGDGIWAFHTTRRVQEGDKWGDEVSTFAVDRNGKFVPWRKEWNSLVPEKWLEPGSFFPDSK